MLGEFLSLAVQLSLQYGGNQNQTSYFRTPYATTELTTCKSKI